MVNPQLAKALSSLLIAQSNYALCITIVIAFKITMLIIGSCKMANILPEAVEIANQLGMKPYCVLLFRNIWPSIIVC